VTASTGRHWRTEVIPAVFSEGRIAGSLAAELLEETQPFVPFDPPTVEFTRADFEFGLKLDRAIAAARVAEQRRPTGESPLTLQSMTLWARARRYVKANVTIGRAVFVAATVGVFVGAGVGWFL
jgi:hypothetical protein